MNIRSDWRAGKLSYQLVVQLLHRLKRRVPEGIESITCGLAGEQPPTNPLVVLKAARWWYIHGKGGADPAFQWAIEWARHLATDTPSDVDQFDVFLEYLVAVGFADETHELR